jgi:hypothetical protein
MRRNRHRGECFARDDLPAMVRPEMLEQSPAQAQAIGWCWCRPRSIWYLRVVPANTASNCIRNRLDARTDG